MKIGDYIRINNGQIAKITKIKEYKKWSNIIYTDIAIDLHEDRACNDNFIDEEEIIKSSPNIIDLIEAGDYVNGKLVIEHAYQKGRLFVTNLYIGGKGFTTCEDYSWELTKEDEDLIETIVTKEQFESMEYRIGE